MIYLPMICAMFIAMSEYPLCTGLMHQGLRLRNKKIRSQSTKLNVVEHLIDCVADPIFGDLYGVSSQNCIQRGPHFWEDSGAFLGQLFQIAVFSLGTIALQRGYLRSVDLEDADGAETGMTSDIDDFSSLSSSSSYRRCPQW